MFGMLLKPVIMEDAEEFDAVRSKLRFYLKMHDLKRSVRLLLVHDLLEVLAPSRSDGVDTYLRKGQPPRSYRYRFTKRSPPGKSYRDV